MFRYYFSFINLVYYYILVDFEKGLLGLCDKVDIFGMFCLDFLFVFVW